MAFATSASQRGHDVTLFDADTQIGGQVRLIRHACNRACHPSISHLYDCMLVVLTFSCIPPVPTACVFVQFNMAKRVPGKEEFHETIRYFKRKLELTGVNMQLGKRVTAVGACKPALYQSLPSLLGTG